MCACICMIYRCVYCVCIWICVCARMYTLVGQKVGLVEFPSVNLSGFFFCTPFPLRILAWSCVVTQSTFHPPKVFNLIDLR